MIQADESTIVLSHHYTREGVDYKPGDVLTVPTQDARSLVAAGYAKAYATPLVDIDPDGTTRVRADVPSRLAVGGTTYLWNHPGEAVPVRNADVDAVIAFPGFDLADPPERVSMDSGLILDERDGPAEPRVDDAPVRTEPTGTEPEPPAHPSGPVDPPRPDHRPYA